MGMIHEIDYGTPASKAETQVTLTVDGFTVTVPEGTSIMRASMEAGIAIPKLCATDSLEPFGSCRLCLVDLGRVIAGFQQGARRSECSRCDGRVPEFRSIWSSSTGSCVDHFRAEGLHDLIASPDAGLSDAGDDELL